MSTIGLPAFPRRCRIGLILPFAEPSRMTLVPWVLPRAVDLLGNLLVAYSDTFGGTVLTTNFDPLIEVSVLKHGGRCYRTRASRRWKLGLTVAEGTHIIHLHGYWQGSDTLHIPHQLVQLRPQLGKSLARLVEASTLVVVGYGGWDDVITRTLVESLSDSANNPEIMWAFHGDNTAAIEASNERLLAVLRRELVGGECRCTRASTVAPYSLTFTNSCSQVIPQHLIRPAIHV